MTHSIASVLGPRTTWYIARASGLTAWCLVLASVLLGLFMSSKPKWKGLPPAWRLDLHRFLGALAVFFTLLHVAALMIDPFVPFGVVDVLVPFASKWHPRAIAGGVLGLYLILVVEVTSLMMRKLPRKWWHRIHLSSLVLLAAATVHGLMSGTDMGNRAVEDVLVVAGVLTVPFAVFRVWRARRQPSVAARTAGATGTGDHPRRVLARIPQARTHDEHVRRAGGRGPPSGRGRPAVVVVEADDVVLAEVAALLHLDEQQRLVAAVLDAVRGAHGDVDGLARRDLLHHVVEGDRGRACDDEPVLGALGVALVAQAVARLHGDALDLEALGLGVLDHGVGAPRPHVVLAARLVGGGHQRALPS